MNTILDTIDSPQDLKKLSDDELITLAGEIREKICEVISNNGGEDFWGNGLYNGLPDIGAHEN